MTESTIPFTTRVAGELKNSNLLYPVDFNLAWQWLGYNNITTALLYFLESGCFVEDEDYQVSRGMGIIQLTLDCFKSWARRLDNPDAKNVGLKLCVADWYETSPSDPVNTDSGYEYKELLVESPPSVMLLAKNLHRLQAENKDLAARISELEGQKMLQAVYDPGERFLELCDRVAKLEQQLRSS